MNQITIVIPCFNESRSLPELIKQLKNIDSDFNFILVDNGSTDNTQEILEILEIPENIQIIKKEINSGYGAGIKYGLRQVKTKFSGWMHADLQQEANILLEAKSIISKFSEESIHNRFAVKGKRTGRSIFENFFTIGVALFTSILFLRRFWDMAGQPNIFKTSSLKFIENAPDDHNFEFYVYINFVLKNGIYKRFNAPFKKRKFGSSSWDKGLRSKLIHAKRIFKYIVYLRLKS